MMINRKISPRTIVFIFTLVLLLTLAACSVGKNTPPLAYRIDNSLTNEDSTLLTEMDERVLKSAPIQVDSAVFDFLIGEPAIEPALILPIFGGEQLLFDIQTIDGTAPDQLTYSGVIREQPFSTVTITRNGNIFSMDIHAEEGVYQVVHTGEYHELIQLDLPGMPQAADMAHAAPPGTVQAVGTIYPIDVLVMVSTNASAAAGGFSTVNNLINLAVEETNQGFENSGVNLHVTAVEVIETGGEPDSYSEALYCMVERDDGCLEEIHAIRDLVYADLVLYVMNNNDSCGASWLNTTFNEYAETTAFGAVNWRCMTGYYGFAKELGHLMGAQTNEEDSGYRPGAYAYSYGYQAPNNAFRTITAHDCDSSCPRINYWSNPNVSYGGQATGASGEADNRLTLNQNAEFISDYRIPPSPPAKATIISPEHNTSLIEQSPTFIWNTLHDATEFKVQVKRKSDGITVGFATVAVNEACDATLCSHTFGKTFQADLYEWRVAGINSIGQGDWSDANTFDIRHPALTTVSPVNNAEVYHPMPTLSWLPSDLSPQTYEILLQTSSSVTILNRTVTADQVCSDALCEFQVTTNLEEGNYKWFVRAILTSPGLYGTASTFVKTTLPAPASVEPSNNAIIYTNTPAHQWTHIDPADAYTLEITADSGEITTFHWEKETICTGDACSFTLPIGLAPGSYSWRIQGEITQHMGYWSEPTTFTVLQLPAPALIGPDNNSIVLDEKVTLQWTQVENPETQSYLVQIRSVRTNDLVYSTSVSPTCSGGICTHQITSTLPLGEYKWRVSASSTTLTGFASTYRYFTQEYTPGLAAPIFPVNNNTIYGTQPTLIWTAGSLAEEHLVQFAQGDSTVLGEWTLGNEFCGNDRCEYQIPFTLTQYGTYQWRVQSLRSSAQSDWSETAYFQFTQLEQPVLLEPQNNTDLTARQLVFTWEPVPGTYKYQFVLETSTGQELLNTDLLKSQTCTLAVCIYQYPTELPEGAYQWQVRATNGSNQSSWSEMHSFEIVSAAVIEFSFDGLAEGWEAPTNHWQIYNNQYYQGTPGDNAFFSALTYYDQNFDDAVFESQIRSTGTNAYDGFSLVLRAEFNENGDFIRGYTIDVVGSDNGIQVSGWKISSALSNTNSNTFALEEVNANSIDIRDFHQYRLEVNGTTVELYVDDALMYTMEIAAEYTSGVFGYDVISNHTDNHLVDVNWASITPSN